MLHRDDLVSSHRPALQTLEGAAACRTARPDGGSAVPVKGRAAWNNGTDVRRASWHISSNSR
jgi:hypothetical protein